MLVSSLPPVVADDCRLLILGSMPGQRSLAARAYYAHPHNRFWPMMQAVLGINAAAPYAERLQALQALGVGIWDVMDQCFRPGSLDSSIKEASIIANDFPGLLARHPGITHICFNGSKAEQAYKRYVIDRMTLPHTMHYHRMPSTSPANASIPWERKLAAWQLLPQWLTST